MPNDIRALRGHLFDVIERLKTPAHANPIDTATAHAICEAAQAIIGTAKVELELVKAVNGPMPANPDFFGIAEIGDGSEPGGAVPSLPVPRGALRAALSRRENKLNAPMAWPEDYTAVEPFERKMG